MRYDPHAVESKWQKCWLKDQTYEPNLKAAKRPFYNLMMFPYPSAEGLHIGSVRTFTGVDIYGRMKRMQGYDVFEPIGLDGFGIHSENYALKLGKHPADVAKVTEKNFYRQLGMIGNGFAWEERLKTYDPDYYKWTQWIFTEMFRRGLVYRKKAPVNWCPSCKTVLADEQVVNGECERCSTKVIKKDLEQWFFRITAYAERLLKNLEKIDWSERVKIAQRNWIGKSEGALLKFEIRNTKSETNPKSQIRNSKHYIEVFTTRPDTLFGATYMVLGPEHPLLANDQLPITNDQEVQEYIRKAKAKTEEERIAEGREKTGVELKGIKAINPATKEEIPVWVADYVLGHVGTGAIMAVPAHDDRDLAFQKKYRLGIRRVIRDREMWRAHPSDNDHLGKVEVTTSPTQEELQAYEQASLRAMSDSGIAWAYGGILMNSDQFNGMNSKEAKWKITEFVGGKRRVQYRLRDWLISRQRYWGPPIPLVFCENCAGRIKNQESGTRNTYSKGELENPGWIAVPEKDLPVELPYIKNFRPTGTDQSPLAAVEEFYTVKCPACGADARRETDVSDTFLDSAWYYLRYPSVRESKRPWDPKITAKWLPVDMYIGGPEHAVLHLLYVRFLAMVFHDWGLLHFEEPFKRFRAHGLITRGGAKMSKSKGNIVSPDEYINAYGADAVRMYLAFIAPFDEGGDFQDSGIRGVTRFMERVWKLVTERKAQPSSRAQFGGSAKRKAPNATAERLVHRTTKKVTDDIEGLQYNTAISALMVLLNAFEKQPEAVSREHVETFLKLLAPFAPHITEELWHQLGNASSIHASRWPAVEEKYLSTESQRVVVQINGRVRDRIEIATGADEGAVRSEVLARPKVQEWIGGKPVKRFIYVPGRIVNIVA